MSDLTTTPIENPLNIRPRAVVIGASSGIGEAIARKLAKEGYRLVLLARRKDLLDEICAEINQDAGETRATFYQHDVTDYQAIPALFRKILQELQTIDVFIYNSGVMYTIGSDEYNFEKDLPTLEVNLLGAIAWLSQAATLFDRMGSGHLSEHLFGVAAEPAGQKRRACADSKAGLRKDRFAARWKYPFPGSDT